MFPICGGNWNNTANAGVFARNWNNNRSNDNNNNGFRAADFVSYPEILSREYWRQRGHFILPDGEIGRAWLSSSVVERQPCPNVTVTCFTVRSRSTHYITPT